MVVSWSGDGPSSSSSIFGGEGDVRMFLFYFEDVFMRGKNEEERAMSFLSLLDRESLQFYFNRSKKYGTVSAERQVFETVKAASLDRFVKREELQVTIRQATGASLDEGDLLQSLEDLDVLWNQVIFSEDARYGFLRVAVRNIGLLAKIAIYRRASDYERLKKLIRDFELEKKTGSVFSE